MPMHRDRRRSRRADGGGGNGSDRARHHGRGGRGEGSEGGSVHGQDDRPHTCEEMKNRLRGGWEGACHTGGMQAQPHVVAVNVGRAAPLGLGDRVVASGIVKRAATGPVAVGPLGVQGDEQADRANHGGAYKAVYAYAREDVAWWQDRVGRRLDPGAFGENLTLAGVDVTDARIGERWRIGSVELEVSGPRVPCAKLGARMGDPLFPRKFVAAGRPGAYLSVPVPGTLQAGDEVAIVERPDHGVGVGMLYDIALRQPWRLAELEPARADMNPELLAWLYGRAA
jgi:MOSC domain-containing protein YiiM